jgi:hypothetical protein
MSPSKLFAVVVAGFALAACDSGDINIEPTTSVSNSNNTVNGGGDGDDDVCASYVKDGQTIRGTADANGNCTYGSSFVGPKNNLTVDLVIPALEDGGAHIFTSSLFVGETHRTQADLQAAGIAQGGDGPTLTIEAGATLAFQTNNDFIIINRGSRILADGRADAPITFTSVSDVNGTIDSPEAVQQWGGIVINGFGVTNDCAYTPGEPRYLASVDEPNPDFQLVGECSVEAEGSIGDSESQYGGTNDDDDSGILRYVVVKHTGALVASGDELNGITFNAVGRSTVVENLQMYSTFDDGIEMFGGSVNFTNYVAVYVRDDSIDVDAGWNGTINNALVIQSAADGQQCVESDGIAGYSAANVAYNEDIVERGMNSAPTISNLTCIISPNVGGTHGAGAGMRFREGIAPVVSNSLVISSMSANDTVESATDNSCLRIDDAETVVEMSSVIFACQEPVTDNENTLFGNAVQFATVASGTAVDPSATADPDLQIVESAAKFQSLPWATSLVDGAAPIAETAPTAGDFLGAVSAAADWTAGWTYGIHDGSRGQPLWFE